MNVEAILYSHTIAMRRGEVPKQATEQAGQEEYFLIYVKYEFCLSIVWTALVLV